ncbi:uncharacterized protein [Bemisia tabaci]|uniref:uncharacterized protein n=1 Tax=Bemisia tabaci TaxID=7038 RepID=UPI003B28A9FF
MTLVILIKPLKSMTLKKRLKVVMLMKRFKSAMFMKRMTTMWMLYHVLSLRLHSNRYVMETSAYLLSTYEKTNWINDRRNPFKNAARGMRKKSFNVHLPLRITFTDSLWLKIDGAEQPELGRKEEGYDLGGLRREFFTLVLGKCLPLYNFDHGDTDTTMYCESLHNKIKTVYLGRKFNRRADDLVNIMLKLDDDIHLALLYKRLPEEPPLGKIHEENTRHMKGSLILDEDVSCLSGSEYLIKSQSQKDTRYTVHVISPVCTEPAVCYIKCDKTPCTHLRCHMYTPSCDDVNALCKHINEVHSVIMMKNNCCDNEDIHTPGDPLDNDYVLNVIICMVCICCVM